MTSLFNGNREDLPPKIIQIVGLCGMAAMTLFWGVTEILVPPGRLRPEIFAGFGTLTVYGQVMGARKALKNGNNKP